MFELMLIAAGAIAIFGVVVAYDGSRDVFHPLIFIGTMLAFLYCWMPWKLLRADGLSHFFDLEQLKFVQSLNILGVLAFVVACLSVGVRIRAPKAEAALFSDRVCRRLLAGSALLAPLGWFAGASPSSMWAVSSTHSASPTQVAGTTADMYATVACFFWLGFCLRFTRSPRVDLG